MKTIVTLNRIFISGFKNLFKINIIFSKIIALLGNSGIGKTNLIQAISFIFAFIKASKEERSLMLSNQDYRSHCMQTLNTNLDVEIEYTVSKNSEDFVCLYSFSAEWKHEKVKQKMILEEFKIKKQKDANFDVIFTRKNNKCTYVSLNKLKNDFNLGDFDAAIVELKSKNDFIHQELLTSLFTFSANSEYSFDSFAFNSVGIATLNNELYPKNEDDTARCLYLLKEKESKIYLDVINCFTNIFNFVQMANFNSLKIPQFGGKIINSIYEEDTIYIDVFKLEGLEEPLSFFDLSFSMKKTLYTLTQIACGSLYKNKIIMIENIDCGISYPLIEKLFSSIVLLNKNSNILFTTQNAYLIDQCTDLDIYVGKLNHFGTTRFYHVDNSISTQNKIKLSKYIFENFLDENEGVHLA